MPIEPQATATQVVEAPAAPSGCEQYRPLVAQYAWDVDVALAVMRAESTCDPSAIGDLSLTYQGSGRREGMSCGLMQVRVLAGRPDCDALLDPATNVASAWRIYEARGAFTPWSVYTSGKYEQYL